MVPVRRLEVRAAGLECRRDVPGAAALVGDERECVGGSDVLDEGGVVEDGIQAVGDGQGGFADVSDGTVEGGVWLVLLVELEVC